MTQRGKLRSMIAAMTATCLLLAMPTSQAAGAGSSAVQMRTVEGTTTAAAEQSAPLAAKQPDRAPAAEMNAAPVRASAPFAIVRAGKKWGALTPAGTLAIPAEYDEIVPYAEHLFAVRQGGKWGIAGADGRMIVPVSYKSIDPMTADTIIVQDAKDRRGAYDAAGHLLLPVEFRAVSPFYDGVSCVEQKKDRFVFFRRDGSRLSNETYAWARPFSEGLAVAAKSKKKAGYIDTTGTMVIPAKYEAAQDFSEGLAPVMHRGKWGFIDKAGAFVIKPKLRTDSISGFHEGLALVKEKKGWSFIDRSGKKAFHTRYEAVAPFEGGLAEVGRETRTANIGGFLLKTLVIVKNLPTFGRDIEMFDEKMKRGYIDKTGAEVISTKHDYISDFEDGMALVRRGGKWGMVDRTGSYIVAPEYSAIRRFSEGFAAVEQGGLWGFVGRDGQIAIAPAYEEAHDFHEDLAVVSKGQKSFFIDKTGRIPFLVPSTITALGDFASGLAPAKIGEKWGFIDHTGAVVIAPAYDEALTFFQ